MEVPAVAITRLPIRETSGRRKMISSDLYFSQAGVCECAGEHGA